MLVYESKKLEENNYFVTKSGCHNFLILITILSSINVKILVSTFCAIGKYRRYASYVVLIGDLRKY